MQEKLGELLKTLGLPIGLAVVIASVASFFGLPLEQAFQLFGVLAGAPFVISLIIDVLKQIGVVSDGTAAQWSAGLNLLSVIGLAVLLKYAPTFDVSTWDAQVLEIAKAIVLIITWIMQLFGSRAAHYFYTNSLGIRQFSYSKS